MMKWLRKYRKQLMVGLVLFAMLSFVGGSALTTMFNPDPGSVVFAEIFGARVTENDLGRTRADSDILQSITGRPPRFLVDFRPIPEVFRVFPDIQIEHYFMLIREAERAGIVSPAPWADAVLEREGISSETLQSDRRFAQNRLYTYPSVRNAFRRLMAVQSLGRRVANAATPSEAQIRHYVRDTEDKVTVQLVVLDARRFVDDAEPVTLEEARSHFEKYKAQSAAESDSGFGYRYPRRVRVQYFGADFATVAPQMKLNDDEVKALWRKNRAQYRTTETVEVPIPAASQPTTASSQPASQPATRTEQREREMLYSEARPQVERALRARKAQERVETAMRAASRALLQPWADQAIDPTTGYKERIPEKVKDSAYMLRIRDEVAERYGVTLRYEETDLKTLEELGRLPFVGFSSAPISATEQLRFADYAFRVKGFLEKEAGSETTLSLQLFQTPTAPLVSSFGQQFAAQFGAQFSRPMGLYLFRVIEARESEPPQSLEAVRTQVDDDIRTARAYERMAPQARELYAIASKLGVGVALSMMNDFRAKAGLTAPDRAGPFARRTRFELAVTNVPFLGAPSETVIDACFAMAAEDWTPPAIEIPDTPNTQAATSRPARTPPPKVDLVGLPKLKKWVVMEFAEFTPVDQDRYKTLLRAQALNALRLQRQTALLETWFDPENIEKRCGYREIAPETADADEAAAG